MQKTITAFYFSHDYNTRNNNKIQNLIFKHGFLGYGLFWALVEELYNNSNSLPINYERFAFSFHVDVKVIVSIINDFDLFIVKNEKFSSKSIGDRLKKREKISDDAKKSAKKKWDNYRSGKGLEGYATAMRQHSDGNATAMPMQSEGNAIKERKGKEIKVKESKEEEKEKQLIKALNSQSQISNAKPQLLNAEIQFPCIHLTPDQLKPMERFSDKTKNEILKHFNTFLQKMVDNHKPKDKGQQEALLNEMVTYQASAIIDALKKAYIAGYQVPYFDKSKINDTSQIRMEPMQDPSILKRALETS
jgi:hypothetical protein